MPAKQQFKKFKESEVHKQIKRKVGEKTTGKRSGDPRIIFELDGIEIRYIRIPNNHKKSTFYPSQSKRIAEELSLSPNEYNQLIDCPMSGSDFRKLARKRFLDYGNP